MAMPPALLIAGHHLRRLVRNPGLVVLLLAIPFTLALIEYGAFGRTVAAGRLPPARILLLDLDQTIVSRLVPQFFAGGDLRDSLDVVSAADIETARRQFMRNQAAALVVVPKGFQEAVLAGKPAEIQLAKNPLQTYGPEMAQGVLEIGVLLGNSLHAQAQKPIARIQEMTAAGRMPTADEFADISRGLYEAGRRLRNLDVISKMTVAVKRPGRSAGFSAMSEPGMFFAYVFPGLAIFALLFISQALAARLLRDRMRGLQRRLAITPVSGWQVLAGGVLYLIAALALALVLLALLGVLIFGIQLRNPAGLILVAAGFAVFAASLQLLILSLARTDRSASFVGTVIILVISLVGGTVMPAESLPAWLQPVAFSLPNGAAQQGLIDLLVHQRTLAGVGGRILTTWLWGLAVLAGALIVEWRRLRV